MTKKAPDFETSMERLDAIVKALERGEAPLKEALSLFQEGTALVSHCGTMLDEAEQQVTKLTKGADGSPEEQPFDAEQEK